LFPSVHDTWLRVCGPAIENVLMVAVQICPNSTSSHHNTTIVIFSGQDYHSHIRNKARYRSGQKCRTQNAEVEGSKPKPAIPNQETMQNFTTHIQTIAHLQETGVSLLLSCVVTVTARRIIDSHNSRTTAQIHTRKHTLTRTHTHSHAHSTGFSSPFDH
jgi:hypothetical protein